jgi:hypothetical protein
VWWHQPVILAIRKAVNRRITVQDDRTYSKIKAKRAGGISSKCPISIRP